MKKQDLLALGLSEELAASVEAASLEELKSYVPYSRFKELVSERDTLKETIKKRDKQPGKLKDTGDTEDLKKQIETLQAENTAKDKEYAAQLKAVKLDAAIEAALTAAKAKNQKAVKALLDLDDADLAKDGSVKGLAEQLKKLVEAEDTAFLFDQTETPTSPTIKGAKPADTTTPHPSDKPDLTKMTYEELAAFMENGGTLE